MVSPICCKYAQRFIRLDYDGNQGQMNDEYFIKNKPLWLVSGTKNQEDWDALVYVPTREKEISFCPSCGQRMPDIELRDPLPMPVMSVANVNDDHCGTCGEGFRGCECLPPMEMWEITTKNEGVAQCK